MRYLYKLSGVLMLLISFFTVLAQSSDTTDTDTTDVLLDNTGDTSRFSLNETEIWIIKGDRSESEEEKEEDYDEDFEESDHWGGIWVGVNGYLTPENRLQLPDHQRYVKLDYTKSLNWKLNFEIDVPIYQQYIKFITGLGLDFNSYGLKYDYTLLGRRDTLAAVEQSNIDYTKNNLNVTYLNLPLMIAFNSHKEADKSFHLSGGVVGGYRFFSAIKQKYKSQGDRSKRKVKGDFHLRPFRYGFIAQVGYSEFNLYASYDLSTLFNNNKGPRLYPFKMGVRLIGF